MALAEIILWAVVAYLAAGVAFALGFLRVGIGRVDAAARGAPIGFRLIVLPGVVALWPILARKWRGAARADSVGRGTGEVHP